MRQRDQSFQNQNVQSSERNAVLSNQMPLYQVCAHMSGFNLESVRNPGDAGFKSRVAKQIFYLFFGIFTFWQCNCRGPTANSVQIEHSTSVQHKGSPNHPQNEFYGLVL